MQAGYVQWWNSEKGHGFIRGSDNVDYFVHHTGILGDGRKNLERDEEVDFLPISTVKGPRAVQVRPKRVAHVS